MLDELGWLTLPQRRQEAHLNLFYKIINDLAQVASEGVLIEAYKGTWENTIWNSVRLVIQLAIMDSSFSIKLLVHGTGLDSLKPCHWLYLG